MPSIAPSLPGSGRAQLVGAIALVLTALGGSLSGVITALSGAKSDDVHEARDDIIDSLDRMQEQIDGNAALNREQNEQLIYHADWICEENEGPPNVLFPCGNLRWHPPPAGQLTPKRKTFKPYPQN